MFARVMLAGLWLAGGVILPAAGQNALRRPAAGPAARPLPAGEFVRGEVLVKFAAPRPGPQPQAAGLLMPGVRVLQSLGGSGWQRVQLPPGMDAAAGLAWLRARPGIAAAEPNARYRLLGTPNDPYFGRLWGLEKIGATNAWTATTGSSNVVVAVLDTGVDYTHPDLAPNVWRNPGEIPANGVDDDANGFTDDVHGFDFVDNDGDPQDDQGHGTHVAGTIAAVGNDGRGMAGVAWTARILCVRILSADGAATTADIVRAFDYVTALRRRGVPVRITNNSWGGGFASGALNEALQAAAEAGILSVCAAGNDHEDNDTQPHYPSGYDSPGILSVAASDPCDDPASFSNWGPRTVHLAAPGTGVLSLGRGGPRYVEQGGTSMAAPHVAGTAALLLALRTNLTLPQLRALLVNSADLVPAWQGRVLSGGRLNAGRAVQLAQAAVIATNLPPAPPAAVTLASRRGGDGRQGNGPSRLGSLSADGRYLAFVSDATNLVAGDTGGFRDIFFRDLVAGTTVRVSQTPAGAGGDDDSVEATLSADGRFVAFSSFAENLAGNVDNDALDVFVWNRDTRAVQLASAHVRAAGRGLDSDSPSISADGRYVVFASDAMSLTSSDPNQVRDIFLRDRQAGTTTMVTRRGGVFSDGPADAPVISADGRLVAFHALASTLVPADANNLWDVYTYDRVAQTYEWVSVTDAGAPADSDSVYTRLSADGRHVAFQSTAGNLGAGAANQLIHTYVRDRQARTTRLASVRPDGGTVTDADCFVDGLSADGRWVAFVTESRQFPGPGIASFRPFVFDRLAGYATALAWNEGGLPGDDNAFFTDLPGEGRFASVSSYAANFAPGDGNGELDVLVLDRGTNRADLAVRRVDGATNFVGRGLVGPAITQRLEGPAPVAAGAEAGFVVQLVNQGSAARTFSFRLQPPPAGWSAVARLGGADISGAAQGAGHATAALPPGGALDFSVGLVPSASPSAAKAALRCEVLAEGRVLDAVTAVATTPVGFPTLQLVSVDADGAPAARAAGFQGISADRNRIIFDSEADTLAAGDTNFVSDVFLHDRALWRTRIVSGTPAALANGPSRYGAISRDGLAVAFQSHADNLVPDDANDVEDVFVANLQNGTVERVSRGWDGGPLTRGAEFAALAAGSRLTFFRTISPAARDDTNGASDVFMLDRPFNTVDCVTKSANGPYGNGDASLDAVTPDGRFVLFTTHADNLAPGDTNGFSDTFLRDLHTGALELVSARPDARPGNDAADGSSLSDDGRWVVYGTEATDVLPDGRPAGAVLWDRQAGQRRRIADLVGDRLGGRKIGGARVSGEGDVLTLATSRGCDAASAADRFAQVFLFHRITGGLSLISGDRAGRPGDGPSGGTAIGGGGATVAFRTFAESVIGEPAREAAQILALDRVGGEPDLAVARTPAGPWRGTNSPAVHGTEFLWTRTGPADALRLRAWRHAGGHRVAPVVLRGPAAAAGTQVEYFHAADGLALPLAAAAGWTSPDLAVDGEPAEVRVRLTPSGGAAGPFTLEFTAEEPGAAGVFDLVRLRVRLDLDADGMPDDWEQEVFGGGGVAGPGTDFDGDGAADRDEFGGGTDARDAGSTPALAWERTATPGLRLRWLAAADRFQRLEQSAALPGGFTPVVTLPFGTTGVQVREEPLPAGAGAQGYFRVVSEVP
ncbi:MAG: S8 family serine peptidase [Limisphaerales bacterium]